MNHLRAVWLCLILLPASAFADNDVDRMQHFLDSLESALNYQTGQIKFDNDIGTLNVPEGFRYLNADQAQYIIHDLWGNPDAEETMGMIVPADIPLTSMDAWAFIITYEALGHVNDDDADDIDYDDLLAELQQETTSENASREQAGYEPITIVGWASKPFYDKDRKVLHWAKEIQFGETDVTTLNYNVRVLGRKGVLVLNAVAAMDALPEVKENINPVLTSFSYATGQRYEDFNPELDEVAAWTIGGLVAGKVLAKAGIIALLLKNIKLVGLAIVGAVTAVINWFRKRTNPPVVREL